jgi:hypothetical protein
MKRRITSQLQQEQQRQQQERLQRPEQLQQEQQLQQERLQRPEQLQQEQRLQQQGQRQQEQLLPFDHKRSGPEPAERQAERNESFFFLNNKQIKNRCTGRSLTDQATECAEFYRDFFESASSFLFCKEFSAVICR